jgi:hypothetical protein
MDSFDELTEQFWRLPALQVSDEEVLKTYEERCELLYYGQTIHKTKDGNYDINCVDGFIADDLYQILTVMKARNIIPKYKSIKDIITAKLPSIIKVSINLEKKVFIQMPMRRCCGSMPLELIPDEIIIKSLMVSVTILKTLPFNVGKPEFKRLLVQMKECIPRVQEYLRTAAAAAAATAITASSPDTPRHPKNNTADLQRAIELIRAYIDN